MVIALSFLVTPLALVNPYLTKLIIDKAYGGRNLKLFFILALIGGVVFIISLSLNYLSRYLSRRINRNVTFDMQKDFFAHLEGLPLSFYDNRSTGEQIYRVQSDARKVSSFISEIIPKIVKLIPQTIFILIIVFKLNWKLAGFAFMLVPVTYIQPYFFAKWRKKIALSRINKTQGMFKQIQEVFSHIRLIKAMGSGSQEKKRYQEKLKERMNFELKAANVAQLSSLTNSVFSKVVTGLIALYGGYMVIKNEMTLGSLTAIMIYLRQFVSCLKSGGTLYESISVNSVPCERLSEILDKNPEIIDSKFARPLKIKKGSIDFVDVYFGYKKEDPVLKKMSFLIPGNNKVAFVGPSGSGKSTILSLILRLYKYDSGSILIDGVNIENITLASLKSQIGIALEKPFLWNDTVYNNILYGAKGKVGRKDIIKAAEITEADVFIKELPNGYDTIVGERGCKISAGQMQRIALARAIIKKPKILILDEAMSSIDLETEEKIMDNILREFKSSTIILVSHRMALARRMDVIYSLESPSIMRIKNYEELLLQK